MALQFWPTILVLVIFSVGKSTALRCYSCDSSKDPWCQYLQSPRDEATQIDCPSSATKCYQNYSPDGSIVIRGCLILDVTVCVPCTTPGGCDIYCETCSEDLCNLEQLAFDECASCDSELHGDCRTTTALTNIVKCDQATVDKTGCYRQSNSWDAQKVRRGCASHLEENEFATCSHNSDTCKICHGDRCNIKDTFQRCVVCDSETDRGCLKRTNDDGFDKYKRICTDYLDSCASYVIPGGKTARGCLKEINTEPTFCPSTNCEICDPIDCNYRVVPFNRRAECFQCTTKSDGSCVSDQNDNDDDKVNLAAPCPLFFYDDQCYRLLDEEADVGYRGCIRNSPDLATECDLHPDRCVKCTTPGCNSAAIKRAPELSCYTCDVDDVACSWHYRDGLAKLTKCQEMVPFYRTEQCYARQYPNLTVERGCVADKPEICDASNQCTICSRDGCNYWAHTIQSCIMCSSGRGGDYPDLCEHEADKVPGIYCSLIDYATRGCYTIRDSNDWVTRGCYDDRYDKCETEDKDRCTRCYGNDCNTKEQGAGFATKASAMLIVVLVGVSMITNDVI